MIRGVASRLVRTVYMPRTVPRFAPLVACGAIGAVLATSPSWLDSQSGNDEPLSLSRVRRYIQRAMNEYGVHAAFSYRTDPSGDTIVRIKSLPVPSGVSLDQLVSAMTESISPSPKVVEASSTRRKLVIGGSTELSLTQDRPGGVVSLEITHRGGAATKADIECALRLIEQCAGTSAHNALDAFERDLQALFRPFPGEEEGEEEEGFGKLLERMLRIPEGPSHTTPESPSSSNPEGALEQLGAVVYRPEPKAALTWDHLAASDHIRKQTEDAVLFAIQHPDLYEAHHAEVARGTRLRFEPNLPRAILFSGPPGTGKTTAARIIATQTEVPLIYVPMESIVSKWYGEGEQKLGRLMAEARKFETGAIVFVDEIDALAQERSHDTHEATRRLLSVLLRNVDGVESAGEGVATEAGGTSDSGTSTKGIGSARIILLGATNRPEDLDKALLSRFDVHIRFPVPDARAREAIYGAYAKHLSSRDLSRLAVESDGLSGRAIRDVCSATERQWCGKRARGETRSKLPPLSEYISMVDTRRAAN